MSADNNHIVYEINGELMGAHPSLDDAVIAYLEDHFDAVEDYPSVVTVVERIVIKRENVNVETIVHEYYSEDEVKSYESAHPYEDRLDYHER
jgi:hypothetical protein